MEMVKFARCNLVGQLCEVLRTSNVALREHATGGTVGHVLVRTPGEAQADELGSDTGHARPSLRALAWQTARVGDDDR